MTDPLPRDEPHGDGASPPRLREPVWTRAFVCATLVNFFASANFFTLVPVTVLLVADRFDASLAVGGLMAAMLLLGALVSRPFAGLLTQGRDPRRVMILCTSVMALSTAACLLPVGIAGFTALRLAAGLAFGVGGTMSLVVAVAALPLARRGEGTGYYGLSQSLAGAIGPVTGLTVSRAVGYDAVIALVVALGALGVLAAVLLPRTSARAAAPVDRARDTGLRRFVEPRLFPLCTVVMCGGIGFAGVFSFIDPWTAHLDLATWAPAFFVTYSAAVIGTRPLCGIVLDRRGAVVVLMPAMIALGIGLVLTSFIGGPVTVVAAGAVCGLAMGMIFSAGTLLAVSIAPPDRTTVAASTYYLSLDASVAVGPIVLGLVIPLTGYAVMFQVLALVAAFGMLTLALIHRRGLLTPYEV